MIVSSPEMEEGELCHELSGFPVSKVQLIPEYFSFGKLKFPLVC